MSTTKLAASAVRDDELRQQGFPIAWVHNRQGANISATTGAVTRYGRVSDDADLDDVAASYLDAYDLRAVEEAGTVTVTVWRLGEDGEQLAGTKTTATRKHDALGQWVTEELVRRLCGEVAAVVGDDGTGDLRLMVEQAIVDGLGTTEDIVAIVREARADAAQEREREKTEENP